MARTKNHPGPGAGKAGSSKRAAHDAKMEAKQAVKAGRVTKPLDNPKLKSKEVAKQAVANQERHASKTDKKAKPPPAPKSESESEDDDDEDMTSGSDTSESESEAEAKATKSEKDDNIVKPGKKAAAAETSSESDSKESSESDSEDEAAPKKAPAAAPAKINGAAKPAAEAETSDESDSSSDEDAPMPAQLATKQDSSGSESSESDEEEETPAKATTAVGINGAAKPAEASSDDDSASSPSDADTDESSSEESESEKQVQSKKRKADTVATPAAKKTRTEDTATPTTNGDAEASKTVFVGGLSWNLDEEWLSREFEEIGEIAGCRIITDKDSGRSKGFGYVDFTNAADAAKAVAQMNGAEIDGRNVRVDLQTNKGGNKPQNRSSDRSQRYGDIKGDPNDTLFVGNISFDATDEIIREEFGKYGNVVSVRLPTDKETGEFKGFGYVGFSSTEEAQEAMKNLSGASIAGRPVRLDYATPRTTDGSPARGGRGGGGRGRGGRGGFGDRGGRGGRGGRGDRGGRGGRGGFSTNRGGFGDFKGSKISF